MWFGVSFLFAEATMSAIDQLAQALLEKLQSASSSSTSSTQASTLVAQLRSDNLLASNISRLSNASSTPSSNSNPQLPSMSLSRPTYSPRYQPYTRRRGRPAKEKVYDMKLIVIEKNNRIMDHGEFSGFNGHYILESPIRIREHDPNDIVRGQILDIVRQRYPEYRGDFLYITRPKRCQLLKCPTQVLDGKGVHTLKAKSTGNIYVMLTEEVNKNNCDEEDVSEDNEEIEVNS